MNGTQSPSNVSTKLQRIAELARNRPNEALTTLAHHIDVTFLAEAYRRTRKDGAAGIDGVTAKDYEAGAVIESAVTAESIQARNVLRSAGAAYKHSQG
jgi:hypothetical protein